MSHPFPDEPTWIDYTLLLLLNMVMATIARGYSPGDVLGCSTLPLNLFIYFNMRSNLVLLFDAIFDELNLSRC